MKTYILLPTALYQSLNINQPFIDKRGPISKGVAEDGETPLYVDTSDTVKAAMEAYRPSAVVHFNRVEGELCRCIEENAEDTMFGLTNFSQAEMKAFIEIEGIQEEDRPVFLAHDEMLTFTRCNGILPPTK